MLLNLSSQLCRITATGPLHPVNGALVLAEMASHI